MFYRSSYTSSGHFSECKRCKNKKTNERKSTSPNSFYERIRERDSNIQMSKEDFVRWYQVQAKECVYCGVPEANLKEDFLSLNRLSNRLQIDRMNNDLGYREDNIVLACKFCNMFKSSVFTYEEMLTIGEIIKKKRGD